MVEREVVGHVGQQLQHGDAPLGDRDAVVPRPADQRLAMGLLNGPPCGDDRRLAAGGRDGGLQLGHGGDGFFRPLDPLLEAVAVSRRQLGGRFDEVFFAGQRGRAAGLLGETAEAFENLHPPPRLDHARTLPLRRRIFGKQRLVPRFHQAAVRGLARFVGNLRKGGPCLLPADVFIGLINRRPQMLRGVAETAAAVEHVDRRVPLPRGQQPLDLRIGVDHLPQRRDFVHPQPRQGDELLGQFLHLDVRQPQQVAIERRSDRRLEIFAAKQQLVVAGLLDVPRPKLRIGGNARNAT